MQMPELQKQYVNNMTLATTRAASILQVHVGARRFRTLPAFC